MKKTPGSGPEEVSSRPRLLTIRRCENSHAFFYSHPTCPYCGGAVRPADVPPLARLVSRTTVRVNPNGTPFGLGLARLPCGAQTLCILAESSDMAVGSEVIVSRRGDLYFAEPDGAG
jgi:uncharacterized OB-fold protein